MYLSLMNDPWFPPHDRISGDGEGGVERLQPWRGRGVDRLVSMERERVGGGPHETWRDRQSSSVSSQWPALRSSRAFAARESVRCVSVCQTVNMSLQIRVNCAKKRGCVFVSVCLCHLHVCAVCTVRMFCCAVVCVCVCVSDCSRPGSSSPHSRPPRRAAGGQTAGRHGPASHSATGPGSE